MSSLGYTGKLLEPLFHNTVNATIVQGGNKVNVIPSKITVELDGRLLPGFGPDEFIDVSAVSRDAGEPDEHGAPGSLEGPKENH